MVEQLLLRLVERAVAGRDVAPSCSNSSRIWSMQREVVRILARERRRAGEAASTAVRRAWVSSAAIAVADPQAEPPINHGSVRPWPTSVARITQNVR